MGEVWRLVAEVWRLDVVGWPYKPRVEAEDGRLVAVVGNGEQTRAAYNRWMTDAALIAQAPSLKEENERLRIRCDEQDRMWREDGAKIVKLLAENEKMFQALKFARPFLATIQHDSGQDLTGPIDEALGETDS